MAASLSSPSEFSKKSSDGSKVQLLPPSSFEKSGQRPADPWQELVQATSDVLQLKQENKQLRGSKHITIPAGEEIKARIDLHQTPPPHVHPPIGMHHLDDIINRQAAEIGELKKQLNQSEGRYQREAARLQSQVVLNDAQSTHKMAALEGQLNHLNLSHEAEIDRMTAEHDREVSEYKTSTATLQEKLSVQTKEQETVLDSLKHELAQTQKQSTDRELQLDTLIKDQTKTLAEQEQKISQLKLYLTETQDASKSTEIWKKEMDDLRWKFEQSEKEKQNVESSIQLLNIRISSQNEILNVQEKELSKVKEATIDKKKHSLLTRWREKVYQLLVQLKCQELVLKDEERKWANQASDLETEIVTYKTHCEILQHSLADKQAELDLEHNSIQRLQDDLTKAQQVALLLDDRIKEDGLRMEGLVTLVAGLQEQYNSTEQHLLTAMTTIKSHSQRVTFASSRVQMLQAQFARRDALIRLQLKEEELEQPTRDVDPNSQTDFSAGSEQVNAELERVTRERDQLVEQSRADSQMLETKVQAARAQYAEEVELLKQRTAELHHLLEEKSQTCVTQADHLVAAQEQVNESHETIEALKIQLAKAQLSAEKDAECRRTADHATFTEQLADMEHKLNEARREHTKAVVSWRQLERQSARDKERATEHTQLLEQHYKQQLSTLEVKAGSLERDRNLLMATLRQEGLIGKYKAQRSSPITTAMDEITEPTLDIATETAHTGAKDELLSSSADPVRTVSPFTARHRTR